MGLLGETERLRIERSDRRQEIDDTIRYPLYENEYLIGMKSIFHMALEQEGRLKENEGRFIPDEKRNIISVIGRRGSGKTTVMDEFCRILKSLDKEDTREVWLSHALEGKECENLKCRSFKFHVLSPIDASILGDKEDLFMLILVSIYRDLEKSLDGSLNCWGDKTEMAAAAGMLQRIFRMYTNMQKTAVERELSLDFALDFLASGYDIQKEIASFIDKVIDLKKAKKDYEYFVIAIDDLDLNISRGYEMLEQLQKYFLYYKIIILISVDYNQMEAVCQRHFGQQLGRDADVRRIQTLVNDYLTKIFHYSQRIYMPDIWKLNRKVGVVVSGADNTGSQKCIMSVKNFIMFKIAESMRIFYDSCGLKRHFCEPETVRELVAYNEFLESLVLINYDELVCAERQKDAKEGTEALNKRLLRNYDQNHERFNEDILMRLAHNTLSARQRGFFEKLTQRDLERRAMYFVGAERGRSADGAIEIHEKGQAEYSYGALLEKIYKWGRECFEDKPLISCVLASFTSEMVREYMSFRYHPEKPERERYKKRLVQFLGQSFSNNWSGNAFPMVIFPQNGVEKSYSVGYLTKSQSSSISINIDLKELLELSKLNPNTKAGAKKGKSLLKNWMHNEAVLDTLECLDMFCVKRDDMAFRGIDFNFQISADAVRSEGSKLDAVTHDAPKAGAIGDSLKITAEGEITWDIMGFVGKSLNYEEEKIRFENNIAEGLAEVFAKYYSWQDEQKDVLRNILKEVLGEESRFHKYMKEDFRQEAAFPFYDLDLAYNVWKRVRREQQGSPIAEEGFLQGVADVFDRVQVCLSNEEEFYKGVPGFDYSKIFAECPYVRALRGMSDESKKVVSKRLMDALYNVAFIEIASKSEPDEAENTVSQRMQIWKD